MKPKKGAKKIKHIHVAGVVILCGFIAVGIYASFGVNTGAAKAQTGYGSCLSGLINERNWAERNIRAEYADAKMDAADMYADAKDSARALSSRQRSVALKKASALYQSRLKVAKAAYEKKLADIKRAFKQDESRCKTVSRDTTEVPRTACVKNVNPLFTHGITDLSLIDSIAPIGGINVGSASRSYIAVKKDSSGNWPMVPVYSPTKATLISIHYSTRQYPTGSRGEYRLEFQASCEVTFVFDHIANVSEKIKALAPQTPSSNSMDGIVFVSVPIEAGEQIGFTNGTGVAGSWDFYVLNRGKPIYHINPKRWQSEHNKYADCPYDYFAPELKNKYYSHLATWEGERLPSMTCGQASHDVAGTLSGGWFLGNNSTDMSGSHLLISSNFNLVEVRFNRPGVANSPHQSHFGFRAHAFSTRPEDVKPGTSVCYSEGDSYAYFTLVSDTELRSSSGQGACPETLPDTYETWNR